MLNMGCDGKEKFISVTDCMKIWCSDYVGGWAYG